jgi:hypothetical protein
VHAAKALLKHGAFRGAGTVGIILDDGWLKHLPQGDGHSLGYGSDVLNHGHVCISIADGGSFSAVELPALSAFILRHWLLQDIGYQGWGDLRGRGILLPILETLVVRCVAPAPNSVSIMACRSLRSSLQLFLVVFVTAYGFWGELLPCAFGQESSKATPPASHALDAQSDGNRPYLREQLGWNWNQRGRTVPGAESAAGLRFRAYQQKMAMRIQRAAVRPNSTPPHASGSNSSSSNSTSTIWTSVGPAPLASDATGDGMQDYNWVSGRATSVLIDPADTSGNTVLLGGAYGGLWKSTNAGSQNSNPASVTWQALIDDQPTLAMGAIALQPVINGNASNVILVGTGETNGSGDSYYGLGILRSTNGGSTWTQIQSAGTGQSFMGIGFSKIAFSTSNPNLVVAATAGDNGLYLGLEEDANSTARGLYFSKDGGVTWNRAILSDGAVPASATAVIYNASQGATGTFYAFIRRHGLYSSTDGQHFTRLTTQPTAGLALGLCPAGSNASSCLIYRGEFAIVPVRNEMYVWVVDVQPDNNGNPVPVDEGIWQSTTGGTSWTQIPDNGITNCGDDAFGPNSGCGVEQGWYNLALAAIPDGAGTDIYAGAINLYKCTLASGTACTQGDWINLTHVYGCNPGPLGAPAHVHPDQHGIAFMVVSGKSPGYFAHDGGISRTLDGYAGLDSGSCTGANQFDSLSQTLGSMTEFVSFSADPTDADIVLGGAGNNGSPKTGTATSSSTFQNALGGDGGFTAINPTNPNPESREWFAENPYVTILKCESGTACNDNSLIQVVDSSNLGGDQGAFFTPYILDPQNPSELLVGTCRVWQISTSGTAPLQLSNDFDTLGTGVCTGDEINLVNALAAGGPQVNGNSSVVYAVTNGYGPLSGPLNVPPGGEVWVTTNAGVSLMTNVTQNVNPNGYAISTVAMDPSDATGDTAYIGIMGFSTPSYPTSHVWKTTNAGVSWTDWTGTGLPDNPVNALLVDSQAGQIYVGTDVGVFVSSTSAASWVEVGPAPGVGVTGFLPDAPVTALQLFNPNAGTKTLVASTYGRGIWNYALVISASYTNVISNSPQTVFPTQTATFGGTLTSQDGYASAVNLSCAGAAPPLTTCTLNPASIIPTATYTLVAGGSVGDYSFNAHAVGTDANTITRDAPVTLHVVDFNLTAPNPNSLSVGQGGTSSPSTFQVTALGSFSGTVTLSCSAGLPAGAACVFFPSSSVSPTSSSPVTVTLTVTAATSTLMGGPVPVAISAMATGAPAAKTQTFGLTVTGSAANFALAVTATPGVTVVNQNVTWNGILTAKNGYSGSVTLTCTSGAPSTCVIAPPTLSPTAGGAGFTVTLGSATTGTFNFAIQGTAGTLTNATPTESLTVGTAGTDVTWTDTGSPTATVLAGQSASYTFSATPVGGASFGSAVNFACAGLPLLTTGQPGASCTFNPASIAVGTQGTPPVTVTLTIATCGPNLPTLCTVEAGEDAHHAGFRSHILPWFTLGWAAMLGITIVGRKRRVDTRLYGGITAICLGLGLMALISCGGVAGSGGTSTPVTVNPGLATLFADETGNAWPTAATQQQFTANQSVTWAVTGGSVNGTIDGTGLYTAPAIAPSQVVAVTATSATAATAAFVTVAAPTVLGASQITVTATAAGQAEHGDIISLTVQ